MKQRNTLLLTLLVVLSACTNLAETNKAVAQSASRWKNDTGKAWSGLFTYNPEPQTPKLASTRYCYQFSSDIVCYDSPQPNLTSRIVGVQGSEGPRMVMYQPSSAPEYTQAEAAPLFPSDVNLPNPTPETANAAPFATSSGTATSGKIIQSQDIPPPAKK